MNARPIKVGGKRSLKAFAGIIRSFGIALTIVFDSDSSDFDTAHKEDEQQYNSELHALADENVQVVELSPDYEGRLRQEIGEELYLKLTARYPGSSKAIRARLIAADPGCPIPQLATDCLASLTP